MQVHNNSPRLPARPATVPEAAWFVDHKAAANSRACWAMGQKNIQTGKLAGDYTEWDLMGNLSVKAVYDADAGELVELHEFEKGKPWSSKVYGPHEELHSFYYQEIDPPVINFSILYRNRLDRTTTVFDETGRKRSTVRVEEVNEWHRRRYNNDVLVYEGIQDPDPAKAPVRIQYFYPDGTVLINYTSHGNGTGLWRLYNNAGQELLSLPETKEAEKNKYKSWDVFMPNWYYLKKEDTLTDEDTVTGLFKQHHHELIINESINSLPVPAHLNKELEKVDWANLETDMGTGDQLPMAINGLLAEEEEIAAASLVRIHHEIGFPDSMYDATYKIAIILAHLAPFYTRVPVVQARIGLFVFNVLGHAYFKDNEELYAALITSLQPWAPQLLQTAKDGNQVTALRAMYILLHAGQYLPETAPLFQQEWHSTGNSRYRRCYAVFLLGDLYLRTEQPDKLIAEFLPAFNSEADSLVKLVLAIQVVLASKEETPEPCIAALITALTNEEAFNDFHELVPFIGNYDLHEYLIMILGYVNQAMLEKHMEPVLAALQDAPSIKQVSLFQVIIDLLLPDKAALEAKTPVRKKALLAIAAIMDDPNKLAIHMTYFNTLNFPCDPDYLRRLASWED